MNDIDDQKQFEDKLDRLIDQCEKYLIEYGKSIAPTVGKSLGRQIDKAKEVENCNWREYVQDKI